MKGKIIKDWRKANLNTKEGQAKVIGAINHFMKLPATDPNFKAAMQHFTSTGDFPKNINQVIDKIHATTNFDNGYEQIFDIMDFTNTRASGFDILDVTSGLTFAKVERGQKAKVYKMSGAKSSVSFDMYGAALGWSRTWFDDQQYWNVEDTTIQFRNKAFADRAADHYALIEAVTNATTWQGVTADTQLSRDIQTIRAAAVAILTAVKDKGYGVTPQTELILLAPIQLRDRVNAALTQLNQAFQGSSRALQFNVRPIYTMMMTTTTEYFVCLPKAKAKGGNRMNLTVLSEVDILSYADLIAAWQRYGAAIGDTDQFKKCSTA